MPYLIQLLTSELALKLLQLKTELQILVVDESCPFPVSETGRLRCVARRAKRGVANLKLIRAEVNGPVGVVKWRLRTRCSFCPIAHGNLTTGT